MTITNKLKLYRQKNGLSQAQLSKMVYISERYYQKLEYGLVKPNVYIAQDIARALQTTVEELFPLSQRNSLDTKHTIE